MFKKIKIIMDNNAIYILSDPSMNLCYKFSRKPDNYIVHYVCYTNKNISVENHIKERFKKNLSKLNKEWIKNIKLVDICKFIQNFCKLMNFKFKEVIYDEGLKQTYKIENNFE